MNLCVQHVFSCHIRLQTNFLHLFISILSGKNGKSLCKSCNYLGYLTFTSRIYPFLSFSLLFKFFIYYVLVISPFKPFTGNFLDIAQPYKLLASKY